MKKLGLFKVFGALAGLSLGAIGTAQAATAPLNQLDGDINGITTVFKIDLSLADITSFNGIIISDTNNLNGTSAEGAAAGLDVDAILISTTECFDAACVAGLSSVAGFDFANAVYEAGSGAAGGEFYGTSGGDFDNGIARLGEFDASVSPVVEGLLTLGVNGKLTVLMDRTLNNNDQQYFLYIGETGGNGAEITADSIHLLNDSLAVPLPGALPLLLSGLAGLGIAGRRRRTS